MRDQALDHHVLCSFYYSSVTISLHNLAGLNPERHPPLDMRRRRWFLLWGWLAGSLSSVTISSTFPCEKRPSMPLSWKGPSSWKGYLFYRKVDCDLILVRQETGPSMQNSALFPTSISQQFLPSISCNLSLHQLSEPWHEYIKNSDCVWRAVFKGAFKQSNYSLIFKCRLFVWLLGWVWLLVILLFFFLCLFVWFVLISGPTENAREPYIDFRNVISCENL